MTEIGAGQMATLHVDPGSMQVSPSKSAGTHLRQAQPGQPGTGHAETIR